ncbi:MAG: PorT family protein [Paramuribaculum sp.]|nr:PorT family protein [Paramuribaculum sp.]
MKRIAISFVAAALTIAVNAQEFNGWGLRAALDVNLPGKWKTPNGESIKMFDKGAGGSIGVVYNQPISGDFYFEPGLALFYDTYSYSNLNIASDSEIVAIDPKVKKFGLRMPLNFGYRIYLPSGFNFALFTGPELNLGVKGSIGIDKEIAEEADIPDDLYKYGYRRFDCSWKIGLGFPIGRWIVNLEGSFGLLDLHKNDISFHENRLSLSLGYDF